MTREEATNMLKAKLECLKRETSGTDFECNNSNCDECSLCYEQGNMGEQKEALEMAIKALEQEPCEDCISRDEAIRVAEQGQIQGYEWQFKKLCNLPPVTPQQKTGRWNRVTDNAGYWVWECDKCGWQQRFNTNYCPDCGAKMEVNADDSN